MLNIEQTSDNFSIKLSYIRHLGRVMTVDAKVGCIDDYIYVKDTGYSNIYAVNLFSYLERDGYYNHRYAQFIPTDDVYAWYSFTKDRLNTANKSLIISYGYKSIEGGQESTGNYVNYNDEFSRSGIIHDILVNKDNGGFALSKVNSKTGERLDIISDEYEIDIKVGVRETPDGNTNEPEIILSIEEQSGCDISIRRHGEINESATDYKLLFWKSGERFVDQNGDHNDTSDGPGTFLRNTLNSKIENTANVLRSSYEREYTSPIALNRQPHTTEHISQYYPNMINGTGIGVDAYYVNTMRTYVYDDGMVVFLNPWTKKISVSLDEGKTWIVEPTDIEANFLFRIGKQSFIIISEYSKTYITGDLFMNVTQLTTISGLPEENYSVSMNTNYLTIGNKLYRIIFNDSRRIQLSELSVPNYHFRIKDCGDIAVLRAIDITDFYNGATTLTEKFISFRNKDCDFTGFNITTLLDDSSKIIKTNTFSVGLYNPAMEGWYAIEHKDAGDAYDALNKYDKSVANSTNYSVYSDTISDYTGSRITFGSQLKTLTQSSICRFVRIDRYRFAAVMSDYGNGRNIKIRVYESKDNQIALMYQSDHIQRSNGLNFVKYENLLDKPDIRTDGITAHYKLVRSSYENFTMWNVTANKDCIVIDVGTVGNKQSIKVSTKLDSAVLFMNLEKGPMSVGPMNPYDVFVTQYGISLISTDGTVSYSPDPLLGFTSFDNEPLQHQSVYARSVMCIPRKRVLSYDPDSVDCVIFNATTTNGTAGLKTYVNKPTVIGDVTTFIRHDVTMNDHGWILNFNSTWITAIDSTQHNGRSTEYTGKDYIAFEFPYDKFIQVVNYNSYEDGIIRVKLVNASKRPGSQGLGLVLTGTPLEYDFSTDLDNFNRVEFSDIHGNILLVLDESICESDFGTSYDGNASNYGREYYKIENIKLVNKRIVVEFENRDAIVLSDDLRSYEVVKSPEKGKFVKCVDYINGNYIVSLAVKHNTKNFPSVENFANNEINSPVLCDAIYRGKSLANLKTPISDLEVFTNLRVDNFRNMVYIVGYNGLLVLDENFNILKNYHVSKILPCRNASVDYSFSDRCIHEGYSLKIEKALKQSEISWAYRPKYEVPFGIGQKNSKHFNVFVSSNSPEYDPTFIPTSQRNIVDFDKFMTYPFNYMVDRIYQNSAILAEYSDSTSYKTNVTTDGLIYAFVDIGRRFVVVTPNDSLNGNDGQRIPDFVSYRFSTFIYANPDKKGLAYLEDNKILFSNNGYLSMFNCDGTEVFTNKHIGAYGVSLVDSFASYGDYYFLPAYEYNGYPIVRIRKTDSGSSPLTGIPLVGLNKHNISFYKIKTLKRYKNRLFASGYGNMNGTDKFFMSEVFIDGDNVSAEIKPMLNFMNTTSLFEFNFIDDMLKISVGMKYAMSVKIDDIYDNFSYAKHGYKSINYIETVNSSVHIDDKSIADSSNRNFTTEVEDIYYKIVEAFVKTTGIVRRFDIGNLDGCLFEIEKFMNDHVVIREDYTGRKKIDICVDNPDTSGYQSYSTNSQFEEIFINDVVFDKVSKFLLDNSIINIGNCATAVYDRIKRRL